ncbi:NAD(P)/FAD-dependent oxidoreductase [Mycolicibacterium hodleri]|uniref:NAD(P)/FAD-dependent oxidoreductase n=1 Tax=Mycolicibacterium hodleri TaxID=49897 RepID=UPI0013760E8B|nr:FAD/NAD(P)-binding oxidoreductase [Mycolicibacterium hodleri]
MDNLVVVGGGLAAHRAVVAARAAGHGAAITVIAAEQHMPYDRPPLSKQLLGPAEDVARHFYHCDDLQGVDWQLGNAAVSLDTAGRTVQTAVGHPVPYDGLVIATGKRARPWPAPLPAKGVHMIRDLGDALRLRDAVTPDSRVVIIGGGFIGCEAASSLIDLGVRDVTIVEVAPHPMSVLGSEVGDVALEIIARSGVHCRFGVGVQSVDGVDAVEGLTLTTGEHLSADVLLVSIGSIPNSEWLTTGSGLELLNGHVVCDEYCFADANIVAAGDVAAWMHPFVGTVAIEHWAIARDMGAIAVNNLLHPETKTPMSTVPTFWSDQFGIKIKSAGFVSLADTISIVDRDPEKKSLAAEAYRNGELIGAIVFNKNRAIINYQRTIAEKIQAAPTTAAATI